MGCQTSARPTERLLQSSGGIVWAGGQDLRCVNQITWGQQKLASISHHDYSIIPKTFIYLVLLKFSTKI